MGHPCLFFVPFKQYTQWDLKQYTQNKTLDFQWDFNSDRENRRRRSGSPLDHRHDLS